ncbi:MAG TPA: nucleotidyl transferase AbiEii/AbiGii toxin family protein [Acidimicrobiales bacterium]|nr:nucleotidyl transferase AbiEii/AbiGii toxin family protein [Acidimicrobiales bacterium]
MPRSIVSGDLDEILLADHHHELVEAARAVLATSDLPPVVLIGGLAVAMRVGSTGQPHRATVDIDLVTTETNPAAVEILADAHDSARHPLVIEGVKVDLIATMEASATDLADLDDDDRLFVAGHRWAFETGVLTVVRVAGGEPLPAQVATPAGLVATKSHAIAAPSTRRRSTKMPADLLDLYRLVERYDRRGAVSQEIRTVPGEIAAVIATVVEREILANPAAATNKMRSASLSPVDPVEVVDVMETFVEDLRRV